MLNHHQKIPAPPSVDALEELADDDILEVDGQPSQVPAPPDSLDVFDRLPSRSPISNKALMTKTALGLPPAPGPVPASVAPVAPVAAQPEVEIAIEEDSLEVFERAAASFPVAAHDLPVNAVAMTMKVQNDPRPAPEPNEKVIVDGTDEAERRSEAPVDRTLRIARADMAMAGQILAAVDGPPPSFAPVSHQSNIPSTTIRTAVAPAPVIPPAPITSPVLSSNIPTMMGGLSPVPPSVRASVPDHHGVPLSQVPTQGVRPQQSSIAPVAVDLRQSAAGIALPPPSRVPVITPPQPPKSSAPWVATAVAAALFLGVGGVIAGFAIGSSSSSQAATSTTTTNEAKVAKKPVVESANGASIDTTPRTAPARDSSQPSEVDVSSLPSAVTPTHAAKASAPGNAPTTATTTVTTPTNTVAAVPSTTTAPSSGGGASSFAAKAREQATQKDEKKDPPAAPAVAAAPAPQPAAPAPTTGVVRVPVDDRFVTIMVDGGYRKVNNGQVVVSCGRHSVRVGMGSAQDVNVPCGGSVFVQN